jgi:hypothetical protein
MAAKGLAHQGTDCPSLPRIASSAKWINGCGCDFATAYAANRNALTDLALDNSDLGKRPVNYMGLAPAGPGESKHWL